MPYSITTKDGITIRNIPDDIQPDSNVLKQRVADLRSGGDPLSPPKAQFGAGDLSTGEPRQAPQPDPTLAEKAIGLGEAALNIGTGLTAGSVSGLARTVPAIANTVAQGTYGTQKGVQHVINAATQASQGVTYQPRTPTGKKYAATAAQALGQLDPLTGVVGLGPALSALSRPAIKQLSTSIPDVLPQRQPVVGPQTSVGAMAVTPESLRSAKAGALPQPVDLTLGAEIREAGQLAFEKEQMKGPLGAPLRARAEKNNSQILSNFDILMEKTGAEQPDFVAAGNSVVKTLAAGWEAAKTKTRAAYNAAKNSPEALEFVDATPIADHFNSQIGGLKTTGVTDHAKAYAEKLGVVVKDKDGWFSPAYTDVKTMEDLRREINQVTGFEPNDYRQAVELKKLIDSQTEPVSGPKYKHARNLRRDQAVRFENRAAVADLITNRRGMDDPKVSVDQVFRKSILNGDPDEIMFLRKTLKGSGPNAGGRQAWRELQGATVQHIRDYATKGLGMDSSDNPIISTAKLNQIVTQLDMNGRLDIVLGKSAAQTVRDLNDVTQYVTTTPPGTLINNSGTVGTLLAALGEAGVSGTLTGLPVPVLTILKFLRDKLQDRRMSQKIDRALNIRAIP